MRVLLTGGCGFIGSHTAIALSEAGHEPVLLDNFSTSRPDVSDRLALIIGRPVTVVTGDVRDAAFLRAILREQRIEAVIHFAGLKAVAESVADPLSYYLTNVGGTLALLDAMRSEDVTRIVFSSSATVYGEPQALPMDENHSLRAINPYGEGKLICERLLTDLACQGENWRVALLRYFNPVGAHPSGLIGEDPKGIPNNLMPLIVRAARGDSAALRFMARTTRRPTEAPCATISMSRSREGHVAALEALERAERCQIYNLGTGRGTSVLELIRVFEQATGVAVPYVSAERRAGDVAAMFASTRKAERELGWKARRGLPEMCADSWRFATRND